MRFMGQIVGATGRRNLNCTDAAPPRGLPERRFCSTRFPLQPPDPCTIFTPGSPICAPLIMGLVLPLCLSSSMCSSFLHLWPLPPAGRPLRAAAMLHSCLFMRGLTPCGSQVQEFFINSDLLSQEGRQQTGSLSPASYLQTVLFLPLLPCPEGFASVNLT